jgi:hypothetical protein
MDQVGLTTGSTLTGVPDQLRAIIEEYTYRSPPLNGWRGPHGICEATSWDAVSRHFSFHKIESAYKTGGGQEPESAAEIIDTFLATYPWVRMWWTEQGQIAIAVIDPDDFDPDDSSVLDLQKYHEGGEVPYLPGDRREVYTHVRMPFMWSGSEQKYLAAYEAHDVAALTEKVALVTDNPWSQCRFDDPTGSLNPPPPPDPAFPGGLSETLGDVTVAGLGTNPQISTADITLSDVTCEGIADPLCEGILAEGDLGAATVAGIGNVV